MTGVQTCALPISSTDDGLTLLKRQNFTKNLSPYQKDIFNKVIDKAQKDVLEDPDKKDIKDYLNE